MKRERRIATNGQINDKSVIEIHWDGDSGRDRVRLKPRLKPRQRQTCRQPDKRVQRHEETERQRELFVCQSACSAYLPNLLSHVAPSATRHLFWFILVQELEQKLQGMADYDELRRELAVFRRIEVNATSRFLA